MNYIKTQILYENKSKNAQEKSQNDQNLSRLLMRARGIQLTAINFLFIFFPIKQFDCLNICYRSRLAKGVHGILLQWAQPFITICIWSVHGGASSTAS